MATLTLKNNSKVIQKIAQLQASVDHQYVDLCKQNGLNYAFDIDGCVIDDTTDTAYPFVPLSDEQYAVYNKLNNTFKNTESDQSASALTEWLKDTLHQNAVDFGIVKNVKDVFIGSSIYGVYAIDG